MSFKAVTIQIAARGPIISVAPLGHLFENKFESLFTQNKDQHDECISALQIFLTSYQVSFKLRPPDPCRVIIHAPWSQSGAAAVCTPTLGLIRNKVFYLYYSGNPYFLGIF
jgi:hypothetical protein